MDETLKLFSQDAVIVNALGLHARSAAKIAEIAKHAVSEIRISKDGNSVDATSIIELLTLACPRGETITVQITSEKDIEIMNQILELVKNGFGEDA